LPEESYAVVIATPERYRAWAPPHVEWRPLDAQSPEQFAGRLAAGRPLFSAPRLESYVAQDLELIAAVRPDVVVGDFRLSLAASARLAGAPYVSLSNACWSPDRPLGAVRPALEVFRGWPPILADAAFSALAPAALRWHARAVRELLLRHGLPDMGHDLRRAFTEADLTLYADLPSLFPGVAQTARAGFLGPVAWDPPIAPPAWWDRIPDAPAAYVTLGSSGDADTLGRVAGWLGQMGFAVIAATAGRTELEGDDRGLFVADYLPGSRAAARAEIVICNGGSPTASQALAEGRPVLGLCSNLDQFLNMRAVEARGAGAALRADRLSRSAFEKAVTTLRKPSVAAATRALQAEAAAMDPISVLVQSIDRLIG
jgi:UDP:flavonoid glycosyltransferase YjiC (YdhE family)